MTRGPLDHLLKERLGVDPDSLGPGSLNAALARRARALGEEPGAYPLRAAGDREEWQRLVNEIVVPETWFFRGGELFGFLARHLQGLVRRRDAGRPVRVLSAACSSGEEPYSLAIALAEAGVPCDRWLIDAFDISSRAIEAAQQGRYPDFSFRELPEELKRRYFRQSAGGWEIAAELRRAIRFQVGNLTNFPMLSSAAYDLVFCRNVLMYLVPTARQEALHQLEQLLAAEGLLCVGPADSLGELERRFIRVGPAGYFLHQRRQADRGEETNAARGGSGGRPSTVVALPGARSGDRAPTLGAPTLGAPTVTAVGPAPPGARSGDRAPTRVGAPTVMGATTVGAPAQAAGRQSLLAQAREMGDRGEIEGALKACEAHVSKDGHSADAYCLMGVLHQARARQEEAVRCLIRALYLEPEHGEALLHLMLLRRRQGNDQEADLLQRRLERIARRGEA